MIFLLPGTFGACWTMQEAVLYDIGKAHRGNNLNQGEYMNPSSSQIKVDKTKANLKKCNCMNCPSYSLGCKMKAMPKNMMEMMKSDISDVDHMEAMFCAFGKSTCIGEPKGCVCSDCQLHKEYNLDKMYYCLSEGGQ